jgi:hypothetical protein
MKGGIIVHSCIIEGASSNECLMMMMTQAGRHQSAIINKNKRVIV